MRGRMAHMELPNLLEGRRRIVVVGCGGAGKSTFSRRLGEALELPVVHLDSFFWKPGWEEPPRDEWGKVVGELIEHEEWIMDGNYGGTMDMRLAASDTAIFLDMPRSMCLRRVVERRFRYRRAPRPDMAPDCPERLEWQFLKYVWEYPKSRRPGILRKLENLPEEKETFVLRGSGEVRDFLREVGGSDAESG